MRTLPIILILLALAAVAQDVPRVEPVRPLRPAPCEDERRARVEAEIRAEHAEQAYATLSRQWLQLPPDTKALASLQYEVAILRAENTQLRERNADLAGFQLSADALTAGEFVPIYNAIIRRANECDQREADSAFREWMADELRRMNFTIRR